MAYRIGWFTTARDKAAIELFVAVYDGIRKGAIKGEISFVFSNREEKESEESDNFFASVRSLKIPLICFSSQKFEPEMRASGKKDKEILKKWRLEYDHETIRRIEKFKPDIIVLAGYMLIVGGEICKRFNMINLHPAVPGGPTGTWQEVIWQLIQEKQDETGAMMHLVTEELDKGPPITYYTFSIHGGQFTKLWKDLEEKLRNKTLPQIIQKEGEKNPLFALIRAEGVEREIPLIFHTIKEFADGRIKIEDGKVIAEGKIVQGGYCLNKEIEEHLENVRSQRS
jgi:phosphoribosylglycinamide formyltransferase-1